LLGYTSFLAGMVFLPLIVIGAPVVAVMHEFAKRIDPRLLASLSCLGFAGTFYWIGLFDDAASFDQIFWPMLLAGAFLGAFFTPLAMLTLSGLSGRQVLRAAEAATLLRVAAGAFGITWQSIVVFRRTPFHQLHLADHFGGRQSISFDALEGLTSKLQAAGLDPAMMQAKLKLLIHQQAAILALDDAFLLAAYLFLALAGLVWLAAPCPPAQSRLQEETLRETSAQELVAQP
jgi:DHA2 family multidrug resistance protein